MGSPNKRPRSRLNSPRIQTCNTVIYIFNIQITIWTLHTILKRLEICIDINIEISDVDHLALISYPHKVENLISGGS